MNNLNNLNTLNYFSKQPTDSIYYAGTGASLDLNFARNKSLMDRISGNNLVTFTRVSSGTYVDSTGVLRSAVTNLLLRSEEFGTTWTTSNASISTDSTLSPDGQVSADSLIENTANAQHNISQTVITLSDSTVITVSVYAKSFGRNWMRLSVIAKDGSLPGAYFDLSTGSTGAVISSPIATSITSVGNGWYRCSVTASTSSGATLPGLRMWTSNANGTISYTGDGTSGIHLWGAQLQQSSTVGEYVPTGATINSAPRFDHNPLTGESLGLRVEESRTNSIRNNTMFGTVAGTPGTAPTNWVVTGTAGTVTRTIVGTGTENGITYLDIRYQFSASGSAFVNFEPSTQIAATSGQSFTLSHFSKIQSGSSANLTFATNVVGYSNAGAALEVNSTAFTPSTSNLISQRYSHTRTLNNASTAFVSGNISITASAAADITLRIGLPQLEQGAFATSVIPTTGATATRSADVASITGANFSSWYNQSEGTVFAEFDSATWNISNVFSKTFSFKDASVFENDWWIGGADTDDVYRYRIRIANSNVFGPANIARNKTVRNKTAMAVKAFDSAVCGDGGSVVTGTPSNLPIIDRVFIGSADGFSQYTNSTIRRLTYFPQRISNANLQRITQ